MKELNEIRQEFKQWANGQKVPIEVNELWNWFMESPLGEMIEGLPFRSEEMNRRMMDILDREQTLILKESAVREKLEEMEAMIRKGFMEIKELRMHHGLNALTGEKDE